MFVIHSSLVRSYLNLIRDLTKSKVTDMEIFILSVNDISFIDIRHLQKNNSNIDTIQVNNHRTIIDKKRDNIINKIKTL